MVVSRLRRPRSKERGGGRSALSVYALAAIYFVIATTGSMTAFAISIDFAHRDGGKTLVSAILVSGACAQIFISPLLTPLFDRFRPSTVARGAMATEAVCLTVLFLSPTPLVLISGNLVVSALAGLSVPAIFALADNKSSDNRRASTFSLLDTARLCGTFAGPLLGGILLDAGTLRTALAVEVCAVSVSLLVITVAGRGSSAMEIQEDDSAPRKPKGFLASIAEAPSLLLKNKDTREALTSIWAAIIFTSLYNVALVFYATQTLGVSGLVYAILFQAFIVGRIIGAKLSSHVDEKSAKNYLVRGGVAMGVCIALPGVFPSLGLSLAMFLMAGVCNALQVAALRMIIVSKAAPEIKPKALSAMGSVNSSAMLIGYVIGAPVVAALGPTSSLVLSGVGTVIFTLTPRLVRIVSKTNY